MPARESQPPWYSVALRDLFAILATSENGLSREEAGIRLQRYGANRMPHKPPPSWWQILGRQFLSPFIYILAVAALVAALVHPDNPTDSLFILAVLVLNAAIGWYQESKAERSSQALFHLLHIRASVLRDGDINDVDGEEVVPGDIVWLETGNRVPADSRLLMSHGLELDESLLTGESLPVLKESGWKGDEGLPVAEHRNMVYAGAVVLRGRAKGLVVATGPATVVGQLALDVLGATGGRPPLLERMDRFAKMIGGGVLIAVVIICGFGILYRGYSLTDMFLFSVALAVSAIPEGLPVALTVALAVATTRMARRDVIVRRLAAVEGLGSCTLIGSDKTGTLTCNELTVRRVHLANGASLSVSGEGFVPEGEVVFDNPELAADTSTQLQDLALAGVLCNEGNLWQRQEVWKWRGDPIDLALLAMGHKMGLVKEAVVSQYPQVNEIPFESERQYAATFHRAMDEIVVFVKGAPERVLGMCRFAEQDADLHRLEATSSALAEQGFRVLALASGRVEPELDPAQTPPEPSALHFLGFVGMIDPLRADVVKAVKACQSAGIAIRMFTGDHPETALAIGRELGLAHTSDQVLTGMELSHFSSNQLVAALRNIHIFARVSPHQKLELVKAAQQAGHFVAVTGDGVNDAPALRQANIGVAMGRAGTDVARDAAELVIGDDNFATIVAGVEEGRIAYDNVRKVIYLLVSTGAAEVVLLGMTVVTGWPSIERDQPLLPLLPVQLLWLNLVTNGIQDVALAFEPGEAGVLQRPPRPPREPIFNRLMVERILLAVLVMAGVGFAAFTWMIKIGGWPEAKARNGLLLLMVFFEIVHIGNCRSERISAFGLSPLKNPLLLIGTLLALTVHFAAMQIPFMQHILQVEPVEPVTLAILLGLSLTLLLSMELYKYWKKKVAV